MKTSRGFTLIELLMVIAIIGMLSSVVLASVNEARERARDSRRLSDVKQIQNALELYATDHGYLYPPPGAGYVYSIASYLEPTYISKLPNDPTRVGTSNDYRYYTQGSTNYRSYTILVNIEGDDPSVGWCKVQMPLYTVGAGYPNWENVYPPCAF